MTTLSLQGLTWHPYSRAEPTVAGLDLKIPAGQRVLLTGPSGSGKSTVLRALAGLLDEESGELAGNAPGPARPGPLDALIAVTVGREAAFGPENATLPREEIQRRVTAALDAAHVDLEASRAPLEASGGQQQRLALAGSLALGPSALLLDEPTSMLDADTAAAVREAIVDTGRAHPGDRRAPHRTVAGPRGPPRAARRAGPDPGRRAAPSGRGRDEPVPRRSHSARAHLGTRSRFGLPTGR